MAYTTINKSTDNFNTKLYTGNATANNAQTGIGFQPDLIWIKNRVHADYHLLFDAVRGSTKSISTNSNAAEITRDSTMLTSFNSDGFTVGTNVEVNRNNGVNDNYASWNWKANGQGSSNTDGSINTTYTSVNTTAGFSICSYTGTGSNATVGHGLGVAPKMIITKALGASNSWGVYHASTGNNKYMYLDSTQAALSATAMWNDTTPTSSVFSVGTSGASNASGAMIAYCFAEKTGYSKFGSYTGNGNADGTFVYTGFKPAFVLIKQTNEVRDWLMMDNKRLGYNPNNYDLHPNSSDTEDANARLDLLSNGFKQRITSSANNKSGASYIYMAFAEAPLVGSNNVPCTAR